MRKPQVLSFVISLTASLPAFAAPQVIGGSFEDGQTGQNQDVTAWYESSTGGASYTEWVNPFNAIQADSGNGYSPSRHLALRGTGWIYQSIGTYDASRAPELGFRFYQGIFTDGNASTGADLEFFTADETFFPGDGVDIRSAPGIVQLGSTFSVIPAGIGSVGYHSGTVDLTGLPDGTEIWVRFGGNGTNSQFAPFDELSVFQPGADSDGDGLSDEQESLLGTDSQNPDTDGDGLSDGAEVNVHQTNPLMVDTDGDLYSDGDEVAASTDPLDDASHPNFTGNGSIRLDGKSHLTFAPAAGVIPSGNEPFTVELWANPETINAEPLGGSTFVFWGNEATRQANGFRLAGSSVVRHYFWGDDSVIETGLPFALDEGGPNSDGWHHFAVTYDGTKVVTYLNGTAIGTATPAAPVSVTDANHMIGRKLSDAFGAGYYHGYLDEIRIWNAARTVEEIRGSLANGLQGNEPGLVAYWNFNGTLEDLTANGIDLNPVGGVVYGLEMHAPLGITLEYPAPRIVSFSRDAMASTFTLTWASAAGQLYRVERSQDLDEWEDLGQVQGMAGETTYTDQNATAGKHFYRIRE
ncbi:hypothetical protein OKA04_12075 [Luteolibacter flavescens]|uniref:LamG-like jellyroll fold domain-containing protein n=1 Tax=Luteolibacter flavescens TaxID=1859460 RepID=A0ABT3FPI5_9BACT|nr:LamG-like jellyroll fold domain-containing protein [Luteolibacter flavescens]MCW1885468.1 hypothetical protein [Luteolibacter flavescens]